MIKFILGGLEFAFLDARYLSLPSGPQLVLIDGGQRHARLSLTFFECATHKLLSSLGVIAAFVYDSVEYLRVAALELLHGGR